MRSLFLVAVSSVAVLAGCGGESDRPDSGLAPTREQFEEAHGPPVAERSEPPFDVLVYCGEQKKDGTGFVIWSPRALEEAHLKCQPQLEVRFMWGRFWSLEQVPGES